MMEMSKPNYNKLHDEHQITQNKGDFRRFMKAKGIKFLDEMIK